MLSSREKEDSPSKTSVSVRRHSDVDKLKGMSYFVLAAAEGDSESINHWLYSVTGKDCVSQEQINLAFRVAVINGRLSVVEHLLLHIDSLKEECSAKPNSALMIAMRGFRRDIIKALLEQRIHNFIRDQSKLPEASRYRLLSSQDNGPTKLHYVGAANALLDMLNKKVSYEAVIMRHAVVREGELAVIASLMMKYYLPVVNTRTANEATPLVDREDGGRACCTLPKCALM